MEVDKKYPDKKHQDKKHPDKSQSDKKQLDKKQSDKKYPEVYITYILRFLQVSLMFGILQGIIIVYANPAIGMITSIIFTTLLGYSFILENNLKKRMNLEVIRRTDELSKIRKDLFIDSPIPLIILDKLGNILWNNSAFLEMMGEEDLFDKNIRSIFVDIKMDQFPKATETYERGIERKGRNYQMICNKINDLPNDPVFNYTIYFMDVTKQMLLEEQVKNERSMVGYLYIDNYEEIMQSIEDVRRPMLSAIIDRKITIWFKNNDTALCKFERDRYMLFFSDESLKKMQERKFDILDEIRNIQVGNDLPVTISMGIGRNFDQLTQSKEDARSALDLALGRGGDQAIIKKKDKYTFYGGKTKEVEKSARVKVRIKAYAFKELLDAADKVIIMGHKNIDVDCLGAAMGVYRAAAIRGKKAQIVLNKPTFSVQAIYDRIVQNQEYKDIFITNEESLNEMTKQTLLVVVDVHRRSYVEFPELLERAENIVIFDHHRMSTDFIEDAVLTYIEPFISSTCEIISEILNYITDRVKLTQVEADALLAGITIDTKNFAVKAGVRTFEAAAFLRRAGADSTRVRRLFQDDMEVYKIKATAIKEAELWEGGNAVTVVYAESTQANILAAQVADELLNIKEIQNAFVMTPRETDIAISARALGDTNVQRIMERLGGGGHKNVAGAQLSDLSIEEAKEQLKKVILEYQQEEE